MTYLFDTHSFIWFDNHRAQLSKRVLAICNDPSNVLYFNTLVSRDPIVAQYPISIVW